MKTAPTISLTEKERTTLRLWLRLDTPTRLALRANIVLMAAEGKTNQEIAERLCASRKTVALWRSRFAQGRMTGIEKAAPRGSRRSEKREMMVRRIVRKTMKERPADGTRWTTRSLAKEGGVSPAMVQRVWKSHGLNPRQNEGT